MVEAVLINGLMIGGVYALLAVGFSLIFGVARIINLAHTAFYMLAAYLIFTFTSNVGLNVYLSIAISVAMVTLIGILTYRLVIARVREHETTVLIVTIALTIIAQESLLLGFGGSFRGVPPLVSGYTEILGVKVLYQYLVTFGVVLAALLGMWALLMKTKLGIAIRCTAQDREVANLMGIDVSRIGTITMAIAVALAAIAGALVAPILAVDPHMWTHPLVVVLAVVVLGGLGSIKGSLLGAFILAFAEALVVHQYSQGSFLKGAVALSVMLVVILLRPEGLFGVSFEEER
jgi:branched-chain amino acid transport system permease protein